MGRLEFHVPQLDGQVALFPRHIPACSACALRLFPAWVAGRGREARASLPAFAVRGCAFVGMVAGLGNAALTFGKSALLWNKSALLFGNRRAGLGNAALTFGKSALLWRESGLFFEIWRAGLGNADVIWRLPNPSLEINFRLVRFFYNACQKKGTAARIAPVAVG